MERKGDDITEEHKTAKLLGRLAVSVTTETDRWSTFIKDSFQDQSLKNVFETAGKMRGDAADTKVDVNQVLENGSGGEGMWNYILNTAASQTATAQTHSKTKGFIASAAKAGVSQLVQKWAEAKSNRVIDPQFRQPDNMNIAMTTALVAASAASGASPSAEEVLSRALNVDTGDAAFDKAHHALLNWEPDAEEDTAELFPDRLQLIFWSLECEDFLTQVVYNALAKIRCYRVML